MFLELPMQLIVTPFQRFLKKETDKRFDEYVTQRTGKDVLQLIRNNFIRDFSGLQVNSTTNEGNFWCEQQKVLFVEPQLLESQKLRDIAAIAHLMGHAQQSRQNVFTYRMLVHWEVIESLLDTITTKLGVPTLVLFALILLAGFFPQFMPEVMRWVTLLAMILFIPVGLLFVMALLLEKTSTAVRLLIHLAVEHDASQRGIAMLRKGHLLPMKELALAGQYMYAQHNSNRLLQTCFTAH